MEHKGQLYFLIGLPRSGKSTFAKKFLDGDINIDEYHKKAFYGYGPGFNLKRPRVVIALDDFRLSLGHRFNGHTEGTVFLASSIAAKSLLIGGYNVLIDDTNTSEESIKRVFRIATNAMYYRLPVSPDICKQRAIECGQPDLVGVIDRQYKNLVEMTDERIEKIREEVKANVSMDFVTKD